jgi:hypothetical protein
MKSDEAVAANQENRMSRTTIFKNSVAVSGREQQHLWRTIDQETSAPKHNNHK